MSGHHPACHRGYPAPPGVHQAGVLTLRSSAGSRWRARRAPKDPVKEDRRALRMRSDSSEAGSVLIGREERSAEVMIVRELADPDLAWQLLLSRDDEYGIDLYWLPLGAGGWFVRLNGRIYEAILARREHRCPLDLYHSALEVRLPEGRFVIEDAWPIPDANGESRGVVVEGPVGSSVLARLRTCRYEVRRWRDGRIPDVAYAVASPQRVSDDLERARCLLDLVPRVPPLKWGRDERRTGDMWNSNSVVSWLLAESGLPADRIEPPQGGRAPGWEAGLELARRQRIGKRPKHPDRPDPSWRDPLPEVSTVP